MNGDRDALAPAAANPEMRSASEETAEYGGKTRRWWQGKGRRVKRPVGSASGHDWGKEAPRRRVYGDSGSHCVDHQRLAMPRLRAADRRRRGNVDGRF
jgi:hypothetical protein